MEATIIALLTAFSVSMSAHLGLTKAIVSVLYKIGRCEICTTFWICTVLLVYNSACNAIIAPLIALLSAYSCSWFVFIFIIFQNTYNKIWQKLNKKKR